MTGAALFLSSSPRRTLQYDNYLAIPSSPNLPPLEDLIVKKSRANKPLRSGSRAAQIPEDAPPSFTAASCLLRSAEGDAAAAKLSANTSPLRKDPPKERKKAAKAIREPSPDIAISDVRYVASKYPETSKTRSKALKPATQEHMAVHDSSPGRGKPWKKFLVSEDTTERRDVLEKDRIPEHEVAKAKVVNPRTSKGVPKRRAETVSKHFSITPEPCEVSVPEVSNHLKANESVELEAALQRRDDWTPPPKDTVKIISLVSSTIKSVTSSPIAHLSAPHKIFQNLNDTFGCKTVVEPALVDNGKASEPAGKKRKMHEITGQQDNKGVIGRSPTKAKVPKKKSRTITELATAAYVNHDIEGGTAIGATKPNMLLDYFPTQDGEIAYKPGHPATKPRKPDRSTARDGTKKRRGPSRRNILLSPVSAMQQSSRQDFVFGTSSQLAREESPSFLRDLQQAMKASNQVEDDPFLSPDVSRLPNRTPSDRGLWTAGSRGADGDLINTGVVDLTESPTLPEDPLTGAFAKSPARTPSTHIGRAVTTHVSAGPSEDDPFVSPGLHGPRGGSAMNEIHTELTSRTVARQQRSIHSLAMSLSSPIQMDQEAVLSRSSPDIDEPPPSNQQAKEISKSHSAAPKLVDIPRPKYDLFTDAQLAREITKYGFKPVKKRTGMIALLNQCWDSKQHSVLGPRMQTASISSTAATARPRAKQADSSSAAIPRKPRGRPRKNSVLAADSAEELDKPAKKPRGHPKRDQTTASKSTSTSTKNATAASMPSAPGLSKVTTPRRGKKAATQPTEVLDSDVDSLLSSPAQIFSSPATADVSITDDTEMSLAASPTSQQSALFSHITMAVTTAPRTTDPQKPSWHEKMLMYDPIVLEDLAAWLNAGELDRVGYDEEVSPHDVKRWCESKSICCLWRVNLAGKERKRF